MRSSLKFFALPALVYGLIFAAFSWPAPLYFFTRLIGNSGDGFQCAWNLWWVDRALHLGQSPWHTTYLFHPHGVSLLGHTLNPVNGLAAVGLLKILTLAQTYNALLIFSFVMGGCTAFWLAYDSSRSYPASLLAACVFTFSPFHFAHAEGHLQLCTLQWLPLFLLFTIRLAERPGLWTALGAAATLCLVVLSDFYFMLYGALAALVIFAWKAWRLRRPLFFLEDPHCAPFAVFAAAALGSSGLLAAAFFLADKADPHLSVFFTNVHSMDLLAPFIPGAHWRFAEWTRGYWSQLPGVPVEHAVYLGWSVIALLLYARREKQAAVWYAMFFFFFALALGPGIRAAGGDTGVPNLFYRAVETVFLPLRYTRSPVRMGVMLYLCAAVIGAFGLKRLRARRFGGALVLLWCLWLLADYWPKPLPLTRVDPPAYIRFLKTVPPGSGILDAMTDAPAQMFYQTVHERPIAWGYVSRLPRSASDRLRRLARLYADGDYEALRRDFVIRYVVRGPAADTGALDSTYARVYSGPDAKVYDLAAGPDF